MTMMAGPPESMAAETANLALLETVRGYHSGADRLELLNADGESVLVFVPSADPE
jgi:heat shock protein HslJ